MEALWHGTEVPREVAEHTQHQPRSQALKQPLQRFGDEKRRVIEKKLAKL
jgi:hypothetical protein